ncbi:DNA polymerase III subunit gamma/tau [Patescibacteria group bacterium]|nr:DNA polymerase III subunit gamma/tau [Patescibacteria group bacterium]MBU1705669.1 DNA polymerase III subunit gamma/tau [Patescibacteria group bacterium]
MSQAIYRKYRPGKFSDVTGQDHVIQTLQNQIKNDSVAHAYLFTGPRGIGKTTVARLLAKAVNCEKSKDFEPCNACPACEDIAGGASLDVVEIDAASQTDVENVRENIVKSVRFTPNRLKYKVYIIDEVHMLSASSFNALLKTLEEPPAHGIFILATTEIHKVPQTIISRCQRFDFRRIPVPMLVARLMGIIDQEGIKVDEDVLQEVARHADGCARDAESLLGQILAMAGQDSISMEAASLVLPATTTVLVLDFVDSLANDQAKAAIEQLDNYVEQGIDMPQFMDDVIDFFRILLFAKMGNRDLLEMSFNSDTVAGADQILPKLTLSKITQAIAAFLEARRHMKLDKIPQLSAELAVLDLCGKKVGREEEGRVEDSSKLDFKEQGAGSGSEREVGNNQQELETNEIVGEVEKEPTVPIQAKETVFDSVPVIDLAEVKRKWPDVFQQLKQCNASLPIMIQAGQPSAVNGDQVEISFEYALYADTMNRDKNKKLLEEVMKKVIGKPLRIHAKHENLKADQAVSDLIDQFGGSVV